MNKPQPPQHRKEPRRLPYPLAQLSRPGIRLFHFRGCRAADRYQCWAEVNPDINGLLQRLAALGQMWEDAQRLLEVRHRLPVGGSRERFGSGLTKVGRGLLPHLAAQGVMGQPFDLFGQSVRVEPFDSLHNPGVEGASPLLKQASVGHLVGEGVLEGVLELGEEARLLEGTRGLGGRRGKGMWLRTTAAVWRRVFSSGESRSIRAARIA